MKHSANGNGSRRPEEIQAEIQRTRSEMDSTLGAIEQRLTPGQLVDQGMGYLKESGAAEYVSNLRGSVKDNPLPIALVGIGLAWLVAADRMDRTRGTHTGAGAGSHAASAGSHAMARASDKMHQASSALSGTVESTRQKASSVLESGRQKLGDTARRAREGMGQARGGYERMVSEQPLALGAIGLAVGAVLAAALPRTHKEDELMGEARDRIADKATQEGEKQLEKARETVKAQNPQDKKSQESRPQSVAAQRPQA